MKRETKKHILFYLLTCLILFGIFFAIFTANAKSDPPYSLETVTATEPRVYVTTYGEKYHSSGCSYLSQSRHSMGLYEARNAGYSACSRCGGHSSGTIEVSYQKKVYYDPIGRNIGGSIALSLLCGILVYGFIYSMWSSYQEDKAYRTPRNKTAPVAALPQKTGSKNTPTVTDSSNSREAFIEKLRSYPIERLRNALGKTVTHKKFGDGIVVDISHSYMKVDFPGYPTKQFQFPNALVDGFLIFKKENTDEKE